MPDDLIVSVWFADGHVQRWPLPADQSPAEALDELQRVIVGGQWFRPPGSTKAYSPYAIVAVDVAPQAPADEAPTMAHRLGEAVADAISPAAHDPT